MKLPLALTIATWLFSRLVPKADREPLIGDLEEEYALRARTDSSSGLPVWYVRQICCSIPHVVAFRIFAAAWLPTVGVALVAYIAVGLGQLFIYWAIPASSAPAYNPLGVVMSFPLVAIIGYFAELSRRRAAIVLAAIMLFAITAVTVLIDEDAPSWYYAAYFFVGPVAALVGGRLSRAWRQRSRT